MLVVVAIILVVAMLSAMIRNAVFVLALVDTVVVVLVLLVEMFLDTVVFAVVVLPLHDSARLCLWLLPVFSSG
eukprot:1088523-Ditylum_brightwellii.AAC.1